MDLSAPVSTIMSTNLKTVEPEDPVSKVDQIFQEHRIHHIPVVNQGNHVIGVISKSDFLYLLRGFTENEMDRFRQQAMLRAFKSHEIMTKDPVTIQTTETIKKAVSLLAENRFRALPVVDENDLLKGIITTHDIVDMVNQIE
jgi:acetoin utilization protein AcuB